MNRHLALILALPLLSVFGCGGKKDSAPAKVPSVKILKLSPQKISTSITLSGTVDSKARAWLVAPVEGSIINILKEEGSSVSQGEVLCSIMPLEQQNLLGQSKMEYEQARKLKDNGGGAEAEAALQAAMERYDAAKKLYKPVPVTSAVSGVVISRKVDVGESVSAKQNLLAVADMNRLVIKTAVSEVYSSRIAKGQRVAVRVAGTGEAEFPGEISLVAPGIDPESRTFDVEVRLPKNPSLRPGMAAEIEVTVVGRTDALVVPQDALVVKPDGTKYVYVIKDSKAVMTKVAIGIESNDKVEVVQGLHAGDEVATVGQEALKDGMQVKIASAQKPPSTESR